MAQYNGVNPHTAADLLRQAIAQKYVMNLRPSQSGKKLLLPEALLADQTAINPVHQSQPLPYDPTILSTLLQIMTHQLTRDVSTKFFGVKLMPYIEQLS